MSTHTQASGHDGKHGGLEAVLFGELDKATEPNASLERIKPDLTRVEPSFIASYDGKPVEESKLEDSFNKVAQAYITGLYGAKEFKNVNGPVWYGNEMKAWLRLVSEEAFGQAKDALKKGNRVEVLRIFNQAYEAQADVLQSMLQKVRDQSSDVQLGTYGLLAHAIGAPNVAKVATNPGGALQTYRTIKSARQAYN